VVSYIGIVGTPTRSHSPACPRSSAYWWDILGFRGLLDFSLIFSVCHGPFQTQPGTSPRSFEVFLSLSASSRWFSEFRAGFNLLCQKVYRLRNYRHCVGWDDSLTQSEGMHRPC